MSIETLLKNATQALNTHATALNRFCDFCETNGVDLAIDTLTDNLAQAEQLTEVAPQVSDEPTATAPVVSEPTTETEITPEADSIEAGLWIPQDEEREEDVAEDVAEPETPAVEEPTTKITVSDVADSMKKLLPNRNAIVAVLDQFGVGKVTELKAEDLPKAKQLFDQALIDLQGA